MTRVTNPPLRTVTYRPNAATAARCARGTFRPSRGTPTVSVPQPDPSKLLAFPPAPGPSGRRSTDDTLAGALSPPAALNMVSGDALLLGLLALLNESTDMDRALQDSLDMMTAAARGCIGEIWLRTGDARDVELRYSSFDGSAAVAAFVAAGRALGVGVGPAS